MVSEAAAAGAGAGAGDDAIGPGIGTGLGLAEAGVEAREAAGVVRRLAEPGSSPGRRSIKVTVSLLWDPNVIQGNVTGVNFVDRD